MPFVSKAQQRFMYAKHPAIAKRWEDVTPSIKSLPGHVKRSNQLTAIQKASSAKADKELVD